MAKNKRNRGSVAGGSGSRNRFQAELVLAYQHMQANRRSEAEVIYRQIVAQQKTHPQANLALAMLMELRGLAVPAVEHLQRVVDAQPDNLDAQLGLAANLRALGRDQEALHHFKITARLNPGLAFVYNNMGNICRESGHAVDAERYLLQAIQLQPDASEAHNNLGALYSEQGRADAAIEKFRQAIACKPDYVEAHRNLATVKKHDRHDDEIRAMEKLFNGHGATDFEKMQLGFGLGKAFEELQQYRQAFTYWSVANRCQRVLSPYDIHNGIAGMNVMRRIFNADLLRNASGARAEQVPIFIVGMPRSGTSLTEQILASHSAVYGAGELALLGRLARRAAPHSPEELGRLQPADWRKLGAEYLAEIACRSDGERYVVDKLPGNFLYVGMIRMMLGDARIIYCRRDPMATGLSCFKNHFVDAGLGYTCDLGDLGIYSQHCEALMAYWQQVLEGEIHESTYETLVAGPEQEIPGLLESCGLPFEEACLSFYQTSRMVATASMGQVRQPIHQRSVRHWRYFEQELQPLRDALDRPVAW